jgi:hypothetical protein
MNELQFAEGYQCLPIRCSGRLISLHNEHSICEDLNYRLYSVSIVIDGCAFVGPVFYSRQVNCDFGERGHTTIMLNIAPLYLRNI